MELLLRFDICLPLSFAVHFSSSCIPFLSFVSLPLPFILPFQCDFESVIFVAIPSSASPKFASVLLDLDLVWSKSIRIFGDKNQADSSMKRKCCGKGKEKSESIAVLICAPKCLLRRKKHTRLRGRSSLLRLFLSIPLFNDINKCGILLSKRSAAARVSSKTDDFFECMYVVNKQLSAVAYTVKKATATARSSPNSIVARNDTGRSLLNVILASSSTYLFAIVKHLRKDICFLQKA